MTIPRIQTTMVDLANLQPGVRYNFRTDDSPNNILEGTFTQVVPPKEHMAAQYVFSNVSLYNKQDGLIDQSEMIIFGNPTDYPRDIFVYDLTNLPNELNDLIRSFGGKSRKTKHRNNRKSKRRRNNRKTKHRNNRKSKRRR